MPCSTAESSPRSDTMRAAREVLETPLGPDPSTSNQAKGGLLPMVEQPHTPEIPTRRKSRQERVADLVSQMMPLDQFPAAKRAAIADAAAQPTPPEQWLAYGPPDSPFPLARITSRAWVEWHVQRGVDPFERKRDKIPPTIRAAVLERDGLVCQLCGGDVDSGDVHLDHIKPWSLGGSDSVENLQVTHSACNIRKGARFDA